MSSPDTTAQVMGAPAYLTATSGARYRLVPEVAAPIAGLGLAAWDEGWNHYVLAHASSQEPAAQGQAVHVAHSLAHLNIPGLQRVLGVCQPSPGQPAHIILEWPTQETLAAATAARGPLTLPDFAQLCWQLLGTYSALAEHSLPTPLVTAESVLWAHGAPPSFRLTFDAMARALSAGAEHSASAALHEFGKLALQALTAQPWQPGIDAAGVLLQARPDAPGGVVNWIASLLSPQPEHRPRDAREALRAIEPVLHQMNGNATATATWGMMMPGQHSGPVVPMGAHGYPVAHAPMPHMGMPHAQMPMQPMPMQQMPQQAWAPQPHMTQPLYHAPAHATAPMHAPMPAPEPQPAPQAEYAPAHHPEPSHEPAPSYAPEAPTPEPAAPQHQDHAPAAPEPQPAPAPAAPPAPALPAAVAPATAPLAPMPGRPVAARPGSTPAGPPAASSEPAPKPKKPLDKAMIYTLVASVVILAATWSLVWGPIIRATFLSPAPQAEATTDKAAH